MRGRLLSTREGTIALGVGAAALAGLVVFAYVSQYRASLKEGAAPVTVLVAGSLIEAGTPGDVVGQREQFQVAEVTKDELKVGAIQDAAVLKGRYATADIFPGEQLTVDAFGGSTGGALGTQLVEKERSISVPVEGARSGSGTVQAGDRVDVLLYRENSSTPEVRTLLQNIFVITPPGTPAEGALGGEAAGAAAILRVDSAQAARLAFGAEQGKLWLVLRPRSGAARTPKALVTPGTITGG